MNAMEELESQVDEVIKRMRVMLKEHDDPGAAYNRPKINEMAHRLKVQIERMYKHTEETDAADRHDAESEKPASVRRNR